MPLSNSVMIGPEVWARFQPADESADAAIHNLPAHGPLRVLVVDDNKDTADSLCMLAQIWGFQSERAYDGVAALDMVSAYRPDVLLLDIAMPKMDGFRLAQQIREMAACKDILLIAITGHAGPEHRLQCERAGFDDFLIKPADPSAIMKLLVREAARRAANRRS